MIETAELAGYFAAHSVWSVSDGEALIPIHAYTLPDGEGGMNRYQLGELRESALAARKALEVNDEGAVRGVVVVDSFLHSEDRDTVYAGVTSHEEGSAVWNAHLADPG